MAVFSPIRPSGTDHSFLRYPPHPSTGLSPYSWRGTRLGRPSTTRRATTATAALKLPNSRPLFGRSFRRRPKRCREGPPSPRTWVRIVPLKGLWGGRSIPHRGHGGVSTDGRGYDLPAPAMVDRPASGTIDLADGVGVVVGTSASGSAGHHNICIGEPEDKMMHRINEILADTFMTVVGLKDQFREKEQGLQQAQSQAERAMELGRAVTTAVEDLAANKLEADAALATMAAQAAAAAQQAQASQSQAHAPEDVAAAAIAAREASSLDASSATRQLRELHDAVRREEPAVLA